MAGTRELEFADASWPETRSAKFNARIFELVVSDENHMQRVGEIRIWRGPEERRLRERRECPRVEPRQLRRRAR